MSGKRKSSGRDEGRPEKRTPGEPLPHRSRKKQLPVPVRHDPSDVGEVAAPMDVVPGDDVPTTSRVADLNDMILAVNVERTVQGVEPMEYLVNTTSVESHRGLFCFYRCLNRS